MSSCFWAFPLGASSGGTKGREPRGHRGALWAHELGLFALGLVNLWWGQGSFSQWQENPHPLFSPRSPPVFFAFLSTTAVYG